MPTPAKLKASFIANCYYHFVCKSIDGILLFPDITDYLVFTDRFKKFTDEFLETWSFCLLPNHTHHIIKIKSPETIKNSIATFPLANRTKAMLSFLDDSTNEITFDKMIDRQMNSFLVSYANYYNNKYQRQGGIFQKPFKRIAIDDDAHLQQAIIYTHANAQKHGITNDYKKYPFSSYTAIIKDNEYYTNSKNVIDFFGGIEKFIQIHNSQVEYYYQNNWPNSKLE
jgi:putative transposase